MRHRSHEGFSDTARPGQGHKWVFAVCAGAIKVPAEYLGNSQGLLRAAPLTSLFCEQITTSILRAHK